MCKKIKINKLAKILYFTIYANCITATAAFSQLSRTVTELKYDWLFLKKDIPSAASVTLNEKGWKKINVPHDWAISGPFSVENDIQKVQVTEDGEQKATLKSGRTGGLPYMGVGWYRKHLLIKKELKNTKYYLEFDGAMSNAKVYLNNQFVGEWPYGYSSFNFDITAFVKPNADNVLAVRLENFTQASRWYPGAGIYRNVRLVQSNPVRIAPWGTFITTPKITKDAAQVNIETRIEFAKENASTYSLITCIYNHLNEKIATNTISAASEKNVQKLTINQPLFWTAEKPQMYYAISTIKKNGQTVDEYKTEFGVRTIAFTPEKGMLVNGEVVKLKGVCLHDDFGPLGMAVNKSVLVNRLKLLKEMGCNAIRGTHNPHTPEMLELCDQMGFYFIDEAFDEWKSPKVKNGYHLMFDKWAQKDIEAMILRDRNHPALIMYSIGNEIKEQAEKDGAAVAKYLTKICHNLDSTRPVTAGFNNMNQAIINGLADAVDIPGWNYKPEAYVRLHREHPNWVILGSETVSTVSSNGAFKLPAKTGSMKLWPDNQSTAYDLEYCSWSQLPDTEWKHQENEFVAGEFVWTGYDYLGEPTPYGSSWPSRSSYFGIIDLCGIPKDRYYLYQSKWASKKVLHLLPHWNWKGEEGKIVPVFVYTNYPSAEVFINGVSYGKRTFNKENLLDRYRLRWENTKYEAGELKVVAYDKDGKIAETKTIKTAAQPSQITLKADRTSLTANGEDIALVTVTVTDKDGNLCPLSDDLIHFEVTGAATLRAVGNGDATSLASFEIPQSKAFYGKCMAYVQSKKSEGSITLKAWGKNLAPTTIVLKATK